MIGVDVRTWNELPEQVRYVVREHIGPVTAGTTITAGQNSDLAIVLTRADGSPVFVKGVDGVSPRMRWLRNETIAAPLTGGISPGLLFSVDVAGWLVVGFEYVTGRPAGMAPGSPDLPVIARTLERISALPGAGLRPLQERWSVTDWWQKLAAAAPAEVEGWDVSEATEWSELFPVLVDGDRLAHTDLHGDQFLLGTDGALRVVDWGYPGVGAPWTDAAFMVLRLIETGHSSAEAEAWLADNVACFAHADDRCLTAFAVYIAGLWGYWAATGDIPGARGRARVARQYAAWRLKQPLVNAGVSRHSPPWQHGTRRSRA